MTRHQVWYMQDRVKQDHSHLWGPALSQIIGRDDDWWTCFCRQGGLSRQHQGLRYLGSTLTQSSDHAVAWTQPCICFGSASGLRQRANDLRLTSGPCGGRKEGPQGRNGSVNPLALRQRGTLIRPLVLCHFSLPTARLQSEFKSLEEQAGGI